MPEIHSDRPSAWRVFQVLMAVVLLCAAAARWIDSNGGKTLIHKVPVEINEQTYITGKIYRPLTAQSLNQRPAVLLFNAISDDTETNSPLAIELANRGIVALSLESRATDTDGNPSQPELTVMLQSGYQFLEAQPFVRNGMIGLAAISLPADSSVQPAVLALFREIIAIDSDSITGAIQINSSTIAGQTPSGVIQAALDNLHVGLQIPNDANLWFDSTRQSAILREFLLLIGFVAFLAGIPLLYLLILGVVDKIRLRIASLSAGIFNLCVFILTFALVWLIIWSFSRVFMTELRFFASGLRPLTLSKFIDFLKWFPAGLFLFSLQRSGFKKFGFSKTMLFVALLLLSPLLVRWILPQSGLHFSQFALTRSPVPLHLCAILLVIIAWLIFSEFQNCLLKRNIHSIASLALCSTIVTWVFISNLAIINLE